jgi:hypothetical protein
MAPVMAAQLWVLVISLPSMLPGFSVTMNGSLLHIEFLHSTVG